MTSIATKKECFVIVTFAALSMVLGTTIVQAGGNGQITAPKPVPAGAKSGQGSSKAPAASNAGSGAGSGWSAEIAPDGRQSLVLSDAQVAAVQKVSDYFNGLKTLKGRFIQTGSDKKVMKGKFKMMRPGRFRFDYARPSLQVIISDGEYLAIQDHDLGNEDRVSLDQTPFRVLLKKKVDVKSDSRIIAVQSSGDTIMVALRDKSPDTPGQIRLKFSNSPEFQLKEWVTTDAQGLDTHVEVSHLQKDVKLDAREFVIRAPKKTTLR